jgi:hypothetical protein
MFVEGGWTRKKRKAFEAGFREFLNHVTINSKDTGPIILGQHLFDAQERFIKAVFDALEEDIHDIYVLKSRQLGASTLTRAFSVFWLGMHPGLTGGLVFDTDFNKKSARREIENMIRSLPPEMQFPAIEASNREGLTLTNQSTILFFAAGIKVSKGSGTLGRSIGLSYGHQSEICSWANPEGLVAYREALSKVHPNRLYIWESTARGYNDWWRMWVEAKADEGQKRCLFLGWWSKPSQMIRRSHPDFKKFGLQPPTPREQEKILQVKEWYGHQITPEQLAWVRKDSDPLAEAEDGEALVEYEADSYKLSEQPWTEEDAFQQSGSIFFPPESLKKMSDSYVKTPDKMYSFATFAEFIDTRIHPVTNIRQAQLKVWEEPEVGDAFYVVSADPAYGSSERSDRSVVQVIRCYADGCDQVAEYAWPLIGTRQFAWAILAIAGHYAGTSNEVRLIVELNGPGRAVWDEIIQVKRHIASGYQPKEVDDLGIRRVFANVKNYIYTRNDSLEAGKAWQWNTTAGPGPSSKIRILERMRDAVSTDKLHIRSLDLVEEMKSVERNEDDEIGAGGSGKDDRVIAMALAVHCWDDRVVPTMSARKRTREFEYARRRLTIQDMRSLYMKTQFEDMLKRKQVQRKNHMRAMRLAARGYR